MATFGKSIRIYLKDGTVTGIRFGELVNHTIQAIACPRSRVSELRAYPEANRPGLYFLLGVNEETGEDKAYVGEAENVFDRLQNHLANKDFWNEVIFFVSKDENLTKAHVKFLESRAITMATTIKRYQIENGNFSQLPLLPAPDRDAMDEFLVYVRLLLGVFGHKLLEEYIPRVVAVSPTVTEPALIASESKVTDLFLRINNLKAEALWTDEGFVVKKGSDAAKEIAPSMPASYKEIREKLIADKVLEVENEKYVFQSDKLFLYSSPAASIVAGYSVNGRQYWKNINGRSIKDIEEQASKL